MSTNFHIDTGNPITLWCTPHSLYSGKVRSYLIKKGLPYRELLPANPHFQENVVPAVGHFVVPIVETTDGQLIQDSTVIIEELEHRFPERPMIPTTPVQRVVATLLGGFGSEGLLPTAMHYRWSYRAEQEHFLQAEFGRSVHHGPGREERLAAGKQLMDYFSGFLPNLGINATTIPAFEAAYEELLDALDVHFQHYPYLLGGHPSTADFGFMAPLFAHLARDPVPSTLMKNRATNVYRWTERMNLALIADGEFPQQAGEWLPDDAIPDTLEPVLRLMFQDWGAQLLADADYTNQWLDANPGLAAGSLASHETERSVHPVLGTISHPWRGVSVERGSMPQGLWHFERGARLARELQGDARARFEALAQRLGGTELMAVRLRRPIERHENALVFA
ncbi:MAG: glutathione S-transferase family protein [Pseudomonadales bacterium]|nr:glutathione S-transferase family protein [Pseudomonadales bacterium]MCP5164561.1 glutathione S-transferase family protein [Pseudomonadales bacterium]MCP5204301.1 glutathione S-transferase family protein [Pseudomonadales bacterium]